jgi:hypothetical protein
METRVQRYRYGVMKETQLLPYEGGNEDVEYGRTKKLY